MKETSIIQYDDDDDDRSCFHRSVKETSIINYGDDDDDNDNGDDDILKGITSTGHNHSH